MNLNDVNEGIHGHRKTKRLGRGPGSGQGKTGGRGNKGQGQLAGFSFHPVFQGGASPIVRRVPKRGFNNRWALKVSSINVSELGDAFEAGTEVTPELIAEKGLVKGRYDVLKVLGDGEITVSLKVSAHRFSKSAQAKIEGAGGSVTIVPGPTPVEEKKKAAKIAKKAKAQAKG